MHGSSHTILYQLLDPKRLFIINLSPSTKILLCFSVWSKFENAGSPWRQQSRKVNTEQILTRETLNRSNSIMMTRLDDERSKRGVGDGTHLPVSFRQERARPKEAVLKATASPSKPRKRADECTLREPVTAHKQRTFQIPHVDSLLLHPIATPRQKSLVSPSKPAAPPAEAFRARQSPVRKAKPTHNLGITARHTESADDDHETSDAYNPAEDDGDSDVSEVSFSFGTSTASKPARSKQLSLKPFLLPRRPLQVVEPTSVTLNAQPQSMASPKKGSFLEAGRPGSSSDAEPQATIRL